ncbi:hypothetical protein SCHPADRAFT_897804 [Schizopora paradoxa]|uniref:Maintenance of telomere capping protein 1 n=1 Tax=Schizopora paradoxa TaxID=27342 RepID=A0A0H2S9J9_9AGAM|nr:hypothetical protein SCHPADRAFT_897804 [Schizopora paradoxa]
MSAKAKSKAEEALKFLDDLDNLPVPPSSSSAQPAAGAADEDPSQMEKFIDDITQKKLEPATRIAIPPYERPPSRTGTPALRKATERVRVGSPAPPGSAGSTASASAAVPKTASPAPPSSGGAAAQPQSDAGVKPAGGWGLGGGWGSVWSSASAALQQAKSVVDEQVKNLPNNEQAKKWSEGVMGYVPVNKEQLEKFGKDLAGKGLSTFNDILNVVAPPIAEHEVIQVWLSHDMEGYDGIESLVYRAFARVMEQIEGGDLVVNKGSESKPKDQSKPGVRNLNAVDSVEEAFRLAEANVNDLAKHDTKKESSASSSNPTTYSSVFLRVQPFHASLPTPGGASGQYLHFVLYLSDPEHQVACSNVTQAVPEKWIELWDKQDWIEDLVVETLRVGVEVIGQEYIATRMRWLEEEDKPTPAVAEETEKDTTQ